MTKSLTGNFLIAVPALADPNFFRTAVLLFQHSESGAAGVVINRRTNVKICDLGDEFASVADNDDRFVYAGGPVEGPVLAVHTSLVLAEMPIVTGLYLSSDKNNLIKLAAQRQDPCRFFANYSGWGDKQLESEIEAGGWLTAPASIEDVFQSDEEVLWQSLCEKVGRSIMLSPQAAQINQDPGNN